MLWIQWPEIKMMMMMITVQRISLDSTKAVLFNGSRREPSAWTIVLMESHGQTTAVSVCIRDTTETVDQDIQLRRRSRLSVVAGCVSFRRQRADDAFLHER